MTAIRYTFSKNERLKREQQIDTLFRHGKAFSVFPVKFIYHLSPRMADETSPVRVGFSVPKKRFRNSVKRHTVRRKLFEAWRLNKHLLYPAVPTEQQLHLFLIFIDRVVPDVAKTTDTVLAGIDKLKKELTGDT